MFENVLFSVGLLMHVLVCGSSYWRRGQDKIGVSIIGIGLMIGAGIAKYLGM